MVVVLQVVQNLVAVVLQAGQNLVAVVLQADQNLVAVVAQAGQNLVAALIPFMMMTLLLNLMSKHVQDSTFLDLPRKIQQHLHIKLRLL